MGGAGWGGVLLYVVTVFCVRFFVGSERINNCLAAHKSTALPVCVCGVFCVVCSAGKSRDWKFSDFREILKQHLIASSRRPVAFVFIIRSQLQSR